MFRLLNEPLSGLHVDIKHEDLMMVQLRAETRRCKNKQQNVLLRVTEYCVLLLLYINGDE